MKPYKILKNNEFKQKKKTFNEMQVKEFCSLMKINSLNQIETGEAKQKRM